MAEDNNRMQSLFEELDGQYITDKDFNKAIKQRGLGLTKEEQKVLKEMRTQENERRDAEFNKWAADRNRENIEKYGKYKDINEAKMAMRKDGLESFALDNALRDVEGIYKERSEAEKKRQKENKQKENKQKEKNQEKTSSGAKPVNKGPNTSTKKGPEKNTSTKTGAEASSEKPAHWQEYEAKGDSTTEVKNPDNESKNLLDNIERSLSVGPDGKMTFHKRTKDENGKVISEDFTRKTTKTLEEGNRFTKEDLLEALGNVKNGKVEMATSKDAEPITLEVKNGRLTKKSLDAFNKGLAMATKTILPPEKEISSDKKGWFGIEEERLDENGNLVKTSAKTQLGENKREGFTQENESTAYYGISKFDVIDTKKEEVVKEKKTGIPKWVKGVAISGAIVAGVLLATAFLAPTIMPAISALWHVAESGSTIRTILHGVNVGLSGLRGALGMGALQYAAGTGVWTGAFGAINLGAATAGLGSALTTLAGAAGMIGAGGFTAGKLVQKMFNIGKKDKENGKDKDKEEGKGPDTPVQPTDDGPHKGKESEAGDKVKGPEAGDGKNTSDGPGNSGSTGKGGTGKGGAGKGDNTKDVGMER